MPDKIKYRDLKRYKYQIVRDCIYKSDILNYDINLPPAPEKTFISLKPDGTVIILAGYAWDGPSGPTIDTKNFMRGSLVHDALYQLLRERKLPESLREKADEIIRKICKEDGMSDFRAWYIWKGLRLFGAAAAKPGSQPDEVYEAP